MLHRELDERLRLEMKDPRLVPISITSVQVTRDLSRAVVEYLPLGGGAVAVLEVAATLRRDVHELHVRRRLRGREISNNEPCEGDGHDFSQRPTPARRSAS